MKEILEKVDHTLLKPESTWEEIKKIVDEAIEFNVASVCIPPSFVKKVRGYAVDKVRICTVIGFPNGYSTKKVKIFETMDAISNGADEIDMVINIGDLKSKDYDKILDEIKEIKSVCKNKVLKVIIETCLLNEEEKIKMCSICESANADYIKTSTGFSKSGATFDDVKIFSENIDGKLKIKAAGGINSLDDAKEFINLGADRLGTSKIVNLIKNSKGE